MKKAFFLFSVVLSSFYTMAQQPVHWKFSSRKLDDNTYELHLKATIDKGWHIYAQKQPEDAVAQPTSIKFTESPLVQFDGAPSEVGKMEKHVIRSLNIEQHQYSQNVDFVQKVQLKAKVRTTVKGSVTFQVCTDQMCLPTKEELFTVSLSL